MEFYELNGRLKGIQLPQGQLGGINPTVMEVNPYAEFAPGERDPNAPPAGDWWQKNRDDVLRSAPDILSEIFCLFNKNSCRSARPDSIPSQSQQPQIVQQGPPAWLTYAILGLLLLVIIVLMLKK